MQPNSDQPACIGRWELFDSPARADHEQAKQLCDECHMFPLCEAMLELEDHRVIVGTWAGRLFNQAANKAAAHSRHC